ncbi:MAG: methyltransferase [Lachnospiraceae bacterium]|nr:methyltransferase [Lachnospiraceae bacterium]
MRTLVEEIRKGNQVRQQFIALKESLKEASDKDAFLGIIHYDMDFFRTYLNAEDPKVRKNVIQIIGILELSQLTDDLIGAYLEEQTQFLKAEYVKVLGQFDVSPYKKLLRERYEQLMETPVAESSKKHVSAELRELRALISRLGEMKKHQFIGGDTRSVMIFTTLSGKERYLKRVIDEAIGEGKTTLVKGGVKVISSDYETLSKIRCYQEILFVIPKVGLLKGSAAQMAQQLKNAGLMDYIRERVSGSSAIPYRMELRGFLEEKEAQHFRKQMSQELEHMTEYALINDPAQYELEFRFHKSRKEDGCHVYLKFSLLKDERFAYRTHALSSSMQPYVAAMMAEITKDYVEDWGQMLDPFCGVGTLLTECNYNRHAHSIYGVDLFKDAVAIAIQSAKQTHMDIHYVHKDMADFSHDYLFDLVITDLPCVSPKMDKSRIHAIYTTFLDKCDEWLKESGIISVYTKSPAILEEVIAGQHKFRLITHMQMYKNQKACLYLLKRV